MKYEEEWQFCKIKEPGKVHE